MQRQLIVPLSATARSTLCTYYDAMLQPFTPRIALSYAERLDTTRLRRSLAHVIGDFGEFAGRLTQRDHGLSIEHGRSVAFEVCESGDTSAALGMAAVQRTGLVCPQLSVLSAMRGSGPLFAARVTHTRDGSVLGVIWNHAVGDLSSVMLMLRAWAQAYREEPYEKPLEVLDRRAFLDTHLPAPSNQAAQWHMCSWSEFFRVIGYWSVQPGRRLRLDFSWDDLAAIHETVQRNRECVMTHNDALVSHMFLTLCRLLGRRTQSQFALALEYRRRFGLPTNLIGNMVDVVSIVANGSDDTAAIAARMRNALEEFSSGPVTHRALERFGATRPNLLQRMRFWHECSEPGRTALLISSYASVKLYDLVFESSRPVFADSRPSDAPRGTSLILERPDAAGLTVDLWVPTSIAPRVLFEHRRAPLAVLRDNDAWMGRRPPGDHN